MSFPEVISTVKDIALAGSAITGAVVAVMGLGTWRRQLVGHKEYDLALRVLKDVQRYTDAFRGVRNPVIFAWEMPEPPEVESDRMDFSQKHFYGISKAYEKRWDRLHDAKVQLQDDLLEVEVLWGCESAERVRNLFGLEYQMLLSVQEQLRTKYPDDPERGGIFSGDWKEREAIVYASTSGQDEFSKKVRECVSLIDESIRPKLHS
jgi:hypothetical protein